MNTLLDCIPCLVGQSLKGARLATADETVHHEVVRRVLEYLASGDLESSPPRLARRVHELVRQVSGDPDPYKQAKQHFNELALALLPGLEEQVRAHEDPFAMAARLAVAGNVIDLGVHGDLTSEEVHRSLEQVASQDLAGDVQGLERKAAKAEKILYLCDNAGEIVLDRLLLQELHKVSKAEITVAVRGRPVLNDATREDAIQAGLDQLAKVLDNGNDAPGTVLEDCSPELRQAFSRAALIIAKGQGNYESLCHTPGPLYFLFKVKCGVVAELTGLDQGTLACLPGGMVEKRRKVGQGEA